MRIQRLSWLSLWAPVCAILASCATTQPTTTGPTPVATAPSRLALVRLSNLTETPETEAEWIKAVNRGGLAEEPKYVKLNPPLAEQLDGQIKQAIGEAGKQGFDLAVVYYDKYDKPTPFKGGVYVFAAETVAAPHYDVAAQLYRTSDASPIGTEVLKCPTQKDPRNPQEDPRAAARHGLQKGIAETLEGYRLGTHR